MDEKEELLHIFEARDTVLLKSDEIIGSLNLLIDYINKKIESFETIDISKYDGAIAIIKNKILNHNNNVEEIQWKDNKFYSDQNIFMNKINEYQILSKIYENDSYIKFI